MYVLDNNGNKIPVDMSGSQTGPIVENFSNPLSGKSTTNKALLIAALILVLLAIAGGSYAIYRYIKAPKKETFGYRL